jgi:hypothetical protein
MVCRAIIYGTAEKSYLYEFFLLKVYYLNLLQLWIIFLHFVRFSTAVGAEIAHPPYSTSCVA